MQPVPVLPSITHLLLSGPLSHPCKIYASAFLRNVHTSRPDTSSSDKLFADAAKEEGPEAGEVKRSSKVVQLESQHENWTGEESIKDSVLRMLMDKYKPLRTGTIQSADNKLKQTPPKIVDSVSTSVFLNPDAIQTSTKILDSKPSTGTWASEPLLPSNPDHQPWHTEFKAPTHQVASVKLAQMPPPISLSPLSLKGFDAEKNLDRQARRRIQQAGRLTEARELTLDYRMGVKKVTTARRPNPVNMKGWTSLVEDRIEFARKTGYFTNVKGKGQPLVRTTEESNPFISREEFLMNRIVQRNGAVPPWVEIQAELDTAVATFREILKQSYTRRVVRLLATNLSPTHIASLTLDDIKAHKDPEWIERERGYHEAAIKELNDLVRKYNGMAPYAARRGYHLHEVEIGKLGQECAQDIMTGLKGRLVEVTSECNSGHEEKLLGNELQHEFAVMKSVFFRWLRTLWRRLFGGNSKSMLS